MALKIAESELCRLNEARTLAVVPRGAVIEGRKLTYEVACTRHALAKVYAAKDYYNKGASELKAAVELLNNLIHDLGTAKHTANDDASTQILFHPTTTISPHKLKVPSASACIYCVGIEVGLPFKYSEHLFIAP